MQDAVIEAARFLATHTDQRIMLGDVADHVGYSPFHLARRFERQLGVPPGQFLAAHRFQRAKSLLLSGDERIVDICCAVGFTSVGTFTARFTTSVGSSPMAFRRLPDLLASAPPRPIALPGGAPGGGTVTGSVELSPEASAQLGGTASVYVGLFPRRAARGFPVSGSLLGEGREFVLTDVPQGTYWVLASALPGRADLAAQLIPPRSVVGAAPRPVQVSAARPWHHRTVRLDVAEDWSAPVLVALPPLASANAQDWRRRR